MSEKKHRPRVHYIHRISYTLQERLAGAFVLTALGVLIALLFMSGRTTHLFEDRVTYHAFLRNAQGVSTETMVRVSGIEVGRVSAVDISPDNKIHITLYVYDRFRNLIRADSKAALSKLSILGKAVFEISAGSPTAAPIPDGATLAVEEPLSIDQLLAELTPVMEKVRGTFDQVYALLSVLEPQQIKTLTADMATTLENMRVMTEQINTGQGAVGQAIYSEEFERKVETSLASLEATMRQAEKRMAELKPIIAEADAMTPELHGLVSESKQLVGQLNTTAGTVNMELEQLPDLITRMKLLLESTDRTLEGVQRMWPVSSAIRQPQPQELIETRPVNE